MDFGLFWERMIASHSIGGVLIASRMEYGEKTGILGGSVVLIIPVTEAWEIGSGPKKKRMLGN